MRRYTTAIPGDERPFLAFTDYHRAKAYVEDCLADGKANPGLRVVRLPRGFTVSHTYVKPDHESRRHKAACLRWVGQECTKLNGRHAQDEHYIRVIHEYGSRMMLTTPIRAF